MRHPKYFEDISEDAETTDGRTITETELTLYSGLIGEFHPMHTSKHDAREEIGGRRIPPLLTVSIATRLAQEHNPKAEKLGIGEIRFVNPIHVGDTVTAHRNVIDKSVRSEEWGVVTTEYEVENQDGVTSVYFTVERKIERKRNR